MPDRALDPRPDRFDHGRREGAEGEPGGLDLRELGFRVDRSSGAQSLFEAFGLDSPADLGIGRG